MDSALEGEMRSRIMAWVRERAELNGGHLRRDELLNYSIDGARLPIIDYSRGIRNPAAFETTLAIVSSTSGPYDDIVSEDGLLHYAYRTGDPMAGDNRKLRRAMAARTPLILFLKEVATIYTPVLPVYVVDDDRQARRFIVALDESFTFIPGVADLTGDQRSYAHRLARQRLHQPAFRTRVLSAYRSRCAVCALSRGSLLDAAHVVPDGHDRGTPTVVNGLALCKIHHAAYDMNMLGVSPDYQVQIAGDVLQEQDGPMLKHGLQEMHGRALHLPQRRRDHPDRDLLAWRYERFGWLDSAR